MTQYVYAGAGHWTTAGDTQHAGGLLRRAVDESAWHIMSRGLPEQAEVRARVVHPESPQIVYAGTQHGPYRSTDSGVHWERLDFPDAGMVVWSMLFIHRTRTFSTWARRRRRFTGAITVATAGNACRLSKRPEW